MFGIRFRPRQIGVAAWAVVSFLGAICQAQDGQSDLGQLGLDQLAKVEVTSVSKKEQKLNDVAAAVYVITQEDIRNSTANTIPDLLEMVPGLDVAHIGGGWWALSARGFNSQYVQDTLVLINGRSVFDPVFSGVLWNELDLMLEDIDRIEIIRGPGATIWGSNAFNGIINIITKPAQQTQGTLVTAGIDNDARTFGSVRYGGAIGKSTHYRIYSKYFDEAPNDSFTGPAHDSFRGFDVGLRLDTILSQRNSFMLDAKGFDNKIGVDSTGFSYAPPFTFNFLNNLQDQGENFLGRWIHKSSNGAITTFQTSFVHAIHSQFAPVVNGNLANISVQHELALGTRHDLVLGAEYDFRQSQTSTAVPTVWWSPSNPSTRIASGFVQDEMLFVNGVIHVTTGLRLDHNSLSGFALDPTARILWKLNPKHSLWAAYSLANRTPSGSDAFAQLNFAVFPGPAGVEVVRKIGNPRIGPERMHAFELGYRTQFSKKASLDVATFYNHYFDLIGVEPGQPFQEAGPPARLVLPLNEQNNTAGGVFGAELAAKWSPANTLHFGATYSLIEMALAQSVPFPGDPAQMANGTTPRHQLNLRTSVDLQRTLTLSTALAFVDRRTAQAVPGYTEVNTALLWRPLESGEFKIGVDDLLNKEHVEFNAPGQLPTQQGRNLYGKATWRF